MILIEGVFLPIACNSATPSTICNLRKGVLNVRFPMSGLNTKDYTFDPGVVIDVVPDRCGCNKWFHRHQCGLSERTPRVVTIPWKIPGDLPFELHGHTTLCHIETPLDHKPYTSIEADLDLRQPIERFPQEIITQISKSSQWRNRSISGFLVRQFAIKCLLKSTAKSMYFLEGPAELIENIPSTWGNYGINVHRALQETTSHLM